MSDAPEKPSLEGTKEEGIGIPLPWGGKVTATGFNVVFLMAFCVLGWLIHEQNKLMAHQNELLHEQTIELRTAQQAEHDAILCNQGIAIFISSYPKGEINWDQLPSNLYSCLPSYTKKLPKGKAPE